MKKIITCIVLATAMLCGASAQNRDLQKWTNETDSLLKAEKIRRESRIDSCLKKYKATPFYCPPGHNFQYKEKGEYSFKKVRIPIEKKLLIDTIYYEDWSPINDGYSYPIVVALFDEKGERYKFCDKLIYGRMTLSSLDKGELSYFESVSTSNILSGNNSISPKKENIRHSSSHLYKKKSINKYSGSRTIYTGPRGGKYYINSKGNKTYIKRK